KILLAHAPTGLGKTAAVLCPSLTFALEEGKTVFFLTPKISQHEIAVQLVKDLNKKFGLQIKGTDLVGRKFMCSDPYLSEADSGSFYELCKKRREKEECEFFANIVGFDSRQREIARLYQGELKSKHSGIWSHLELKEWCEKACNGKGFCAYESAMLLARDSSIIIADYYHLFNPSIQSVILQKAKKKLENSIVVVDEAHNLPERVRALLSSTVSVFSIEKAMEELERLGREEHIESLKEIRKAVKGIAREKLSQKNEAIVSEEALSKKIESVGEIEDIAIEFRELGAEFVQSFPQGRSHLILIANFLEKWREREPSFVRIVRKKEKGVSLQVKALDPAIVSRKVFEEAHSAVLMSGTLLPAKMYADLLGIPSERAVMKEYSSPFPKENKLSLVVPSVTTKFSERNPREFEKIAEIVSSISNNIPGNSAVFFPSFAVLEAIAPLLEGRLSRPVLKQNAEMGSFEKAELLKRFRQQGKGFGAVLLAVAAGSFAEGIDYLGEQLLGAIIVGIPLNEMDLETQCLIDYYQEKFGSGWHYGYLYPAVARAIQASGRVIRDRSDRGVVVFLDKRYTWNNYKKCFPRDFEGIVTENPAKTVARFWQERFEFKPVVA
ncbi:MAG: ATP-dependent DNA helicase, partial [Candidatus Diapherotrites archaeon]